MNILPRHNPVIFGGASAASPLRKAAQAPILQEAQR